MSRNFYGINAFVFSGLHKLATFCFKLTFFVILLPADPQELLFQGFKGPYLRSRRMKSG